MNAAIRLLHLEDDPQDAEIIRQRLQAEELACDILWVQGKEDFEAALQRQAFDVVVSDYELPGYDGLQALRHVRERLPELPVIIMSAGLSETSSSRRGCGGWRSRSGARSSRCSSGRRCARRRMTFAP